MKLRDKVILITGGAGGLGTALTKSLLNQGSCIHVCGRSVDRLKKLEAEVQSTSFHWHHCDITEYNQVEQMIWSIGRIDILINNAGIWLGEGLEEVTASEISQVIDINLKGAIYVTKASLPSMVEVNQGIIVNIISTASLHARDDKVVYAASKWGLRGFSESLKARLNDSNIRVFGIYPGKMKTELFSNAGDYKACEDWLKPEIVADFIADVLQQDDDIVVDQLVISRKHC